jgi:hypothetical protein
VVEETFPDGTVADIGLIDNYETTNQKIKVYIDPSNFEPQVTLYRGTPPPAQKGVTTIGSQTFDIPLNEGVNSLGFHVEGKVKEGAYAGRYVWVGFTWVNVIRKKAASTTTTSGSTGTYTCEVVKPESGTHLMWREQTAFRTIVYRDGKNVSDEVYTLSQPDQGLFSYKFSYLTYEGDKWFDIQCFDRETRCPPDVKDGAIGFDGGGLEAYSYIGSPTPERPDIWQTKINFELTGFDTAAGQVKTYCECTTDVSIDEYKGHAVNTNR